MRHTGRVFYGWWIIAAIFVVLTVTAGLGFYNAAVILRQSKEELGASVSAVSGATALFFAVSGLTGFATSRFMHRVDLRVFYVVGAAIGAGALVGLRWVDSVADLYVFFVVFGVAFAIAGLVPSTTIVARWFDRRRSIALSIASTGLSFGGIAITPFAAGFIEDRGLADAGPWLGLVWLLGIAPIALFIRSWPADMGLLPDGEPAGETTGVVTGGGADFERASRTRFFALVSLSYALIYLAQVGGIAQLFNLASERVDSGTAATALSVMAFSSVVGRLLGGLVVSTVPTKTMAVLLTGWQAMALVFIANADTRLGIAASAAVFGLSTGNLLMLQPLLIAETFGVRDYPRIYALCQLLGTVGVAAGPFVLGALSDLIDYRAAFHVVAITNLVAVGTLLAAGSISAAREDSGYAV